ncbi:MAG: hypothetical protein NC225_04865 [Clostridium sp.]|nr:hypothetical protein [Clostridium sp.]MCM1398796.1 hypothetical protein [Clostridium sp.]MCM1458572.1 hypothetical protein [Bacteroides sp.]
MSKSNKGEYGYLKAYRRGKLVGFIIFVAMIEFIVITMLLMFGSTNRVGIVFAILLTLPMAKFFIAFITCVKFKPLDEESHKKIEEAVKNQYGFLMYDLVISQYEGFKFYQAMCVKNGKVCALVLDKNVHDGKKEYENWIKGCFKDSKYQYAVFIYDTIEGYIKKANSISEPNEKTRTIDKHVAQNIKDMCV